MPKTQGTTSHPEAYAIMYCDFKNPDCRNLENVLGSLLGQVYAQLGGIPNEVLTEYKKCSEPPFWSQPRTTTLMTWLSNVAQKSKLSIFVDALDEHPLGPELFNLLCTLAGEPGRPGVIVTGRNNLEVDSATDVCQVSRISLENHISDVDDDIRKYVTTRLSGDVKLRRWSENKYRTLISDGLLSKSNGV